MVYEFHDEWADEIVDVSTDPEYQNALVTLTDPALVVLGEYDIETGERPVEFNGQIWHGLARIIGIRNAMNRLNEDTWNADAQTTIRIQFPTNQNFVPDEEWVDNGDGTWTVDSDWVVLNEDGEWSYYGPLIDNGDGTYTYVTWQNYRVRRGVVLTVDECARNMALETMIFTVVSDFQGSNAASRTIQFSLSGDAVKSDG